MDYTYIGKRITGLLIEKQMSEYKLSAGIGRCNSYIQKITSGQCLPSVTSLYAICDYMDITPAEFFEEPNVEEMQLPGELRSAIGRLSTEDIPRLTEYANFLAASHKK